MRNVENYSREIIDLICDSWKDDEELLFEALRYLYNQSADSKMTDQIVDIFTDEERCLECGRELKFATYEIVHTEIEQPNVEYTGYYYCPDCDVLEDE